MKLVDETVEHSVKHVRTFVHQYLSARLNDARSQIEQYGSRYTEAMLHALETSKQGAAPPTMLARCQKAACIDDTGPLRLVVACPEHHRHLAAKLSLHLEFLADSELE